VTSAVPAIGHDQRTRTSGRLDPAAVIDALREVADPEIPVISVVDLGVIGDVSLEPGRIRVELLPTFVGCPALDPMREAVAERLRWLAPDREVEVAVVFDPPWTTERITAIGRRRLAESGFAPPVAGRSGLPVVLDLPVPCPWCGSRRTVLENAFGPTACRAIRYCTACRQPFEQFKQV
jgi:ring-1,2-phenylacetyl-CoA epoxidase subunit PaaD